MFIIDYQKYLVMCVNSFIESYKGKDTFFLPTSGDGRIYSDNYPFPNTGLKSKKQNIVYELSVFDEDLIISVDVLYPNRIKSMDGEFWRKFVELDSLGKFIFFSHGSNLGNIKSKENKKPTKSAIYDIIRETVLMQEYEVSVDFGRLEIYFPFSSNEKLSENVIKALELLHSINYDLYRKNYIYSKR